MRDVRHDWKTDIELRLCGAASCGVSYLAIRSLMALHLSESQMSQSALPFFLAGIGFLCASAGAAVLVLGHHIFDQVEISERWRTKPSAKPLTTQGMNPEDAKALGGSHPSRVVINQDNKRVSDFLGRA